MSDDLLRQVQIVRAIKNEPGSSPSMYKKYTRLNSFLFFIREMFQIILGAFMFIAIVGFFFLDDSIEITSLGGIFIVLFFLSVLLGGLFEIKDSHLKRIDCDVRSARRMAKKYFRQRLLEEDIDYGLILCKQRKYAQDIRDARRCLEVYQ